MQRRNRGNGSDPSAVAGVSSSAQGCPRLARRHVLLAGATLWAGAREARAFGQAGTFHPRVLRTGGERLSGSRALAPGRWAWELIRRTSAPARLVVAEVAADEPGLLEEPFLIWAGSQAVPHLSAPEVRGLREFIRLGGLLVVDDANPEAGAFGASVRRELRRILPESPVVKLKADHVLFRTFYLVDRPVGRVLGPPYLEGIERGRSGQVLLFAHDLLGALAREADGEDTGGWAYPVAPGGPPQRERAVRLAVNLAMYLLCSDYKDDQVHATWLMRRRKRSR